MDSYMLCLPCELLPPLIQDYQSVFKPSGRVVCVFRYSEQSEVRVNRGWSYITDAGENRQINAVGTQDHDPFCK